jgi:hypothetical protein
MMSLFQLLGKTKTGRMSLRLLALSVLFPAMAYAQVTITTSTLPAGNTSNLYSTTLAASGGTAPYTWQLTGGTLPTGLTLSSAGVISGKATDLTTGTPPVPSTFTVQVSDSTSLTTTQTLSITILPPGSHALVINQLFSGGNGSTSSPYAYNYAELFNASPAVVDLQNWTIQISPATSAFSQTGVYPIGSLDPYTLGTTGGSDGKGSYPAFQITYSSGFTAKNCNPAAGSTQVNAAFPALHCWLNAGQYLLVLLGTTSSTGALKTQPEIAPDLDLTAGYINGTANSLDTGAVLSNVGAVAATSSAPTVWVGHNITASNANSNLAKVNPSDGMLAVVNGVGVGPVCSTGTLANPKPAFSFSPKVSDFIGYIAQLSAGGEAPPICWEGANAQGYATHVSSSGKNTNALIRSAGNGKINPGVTGAAAPAGTILPTTGVTLTPCVDTDNNLSDFAPVANGLKGQINWVLHNGQQVLTKANTTTLNAPADYTPAACPSLSVTGPAVKATFSSPNVGQGAGGGSVTETLTVTVTPSSAPTSTLFNVNVDLSGVPGATAATPLTSSSVGIPDSLGNITFQQQITLPTTNAGTFNFPVTVLDDAYRGGSNANSATPLIASVVVGSSCQTPEASAQTVQLGWNAPKTITLGGQVGVNCNTSDTLTYAVQSQPASGTLSPASGNAITYTPNTGFSGLDSFTFNVTDTTNSAGPLTGTAATVSLVVSASGVTPTLTLNCPAATYDLNLHACTTTLTPFVSGTTTISYNGSATPPTAAGTYPVSATFTGGTASQNTSATSTLVISQALPKLNLACPTLSYSGSPQGCTATVTGVGGNTPAGTTAITYNGSATAPSDGGTYNVAASFTSSDPNYANASATSSLTIFEPSVTITANNQTVSFGAALPTFTFTVSPSIPLQTNPVCTAPASGASNVGTYPAAITCSGAAKVGVLFTYVPGNLTVTPGAATVIANNQMMTVGAAVPTLTFTTTPSGVTFTTAPACTTTATSSSPAGSYPISCTGAVSANYNLSYVAGTMTVSPVVATPNNVPAIANLSPITLAAGAANTVITVTGSNFVSGAAVLWNGKARATTFINATQLTATLLAADLASSGTGDVSVFNPAPGGGSSASVSLSIDSAPTAQGAFGVTASSPTLTLPHGQTTTTTLTFTNLQQGAVVSAACYNLPLLGGCNYSSSTGKLTISTGSTTPIGTYHVLVVCTSGSLTSSLPMHKRGTILFALLGAPFGLLLFRRNPRLRLYGIGLLALVCMIGGIGCGGGSSPTQTPVVVPAQTSTVLTLTVQ